MLVIDKMADKAVERNFERGVFVVKMGTYWWIFQTVMFTPPKFNIAPEKWWLEDYFPIGKVYFEGLC